MIALNAKFIIRFDDLCPTMNRKNWDRIEEILKKYEIKPIIAVIPDNKDTSMMTDPEREDFWEKIREYQKDGWMVALHGYQHLYVNRKAGIMGISKNSEFVGLPFSQQNEKIRKGLEIFEKNGVNADCFVAPSHSFDKNTLRALAENGISVISDGHTNTPYKKDGFLWIPSQLWEHFNVSADGIYTVCCHPNKWDEKAVLKFEKNIEQNAENIISPFSVKDAKKMTLAQSFKTTYTSNKFRLKRFVKKLIGRK